MNTYMLQSNQTIEEGDVKPIYLIGSPNWVFVGAFVSEQAALDTFPDGEKMDWKSIPFNTPKIKWAQVPAWYAGEQILVTYRIVEITLRG